ncbi:hypothetical protein Tco_0293940 [Tanacetum coccineum]
MSASRERSTQIKALHWERREIDHAAGGKFRDKSTKESLGIVEDLALYDNESWNDLRDFAKPASNHRLIELENQVQRLMVAHLAPKPSVQVNKIASSYDICGVASSYDICGGPHETQYCMKNPEQAFVDYASSRNNGLGEDEKMVEKEPKVSKIIVEEGESSDIGNYNKTCDLEDEAWNMSYVMDFTILENVEANIDPSLSEVVLVGRLTLPRIPSDLNVQNTTLFQWPDLSLHNLNRFLDEIKLVIDLGFIQRKSKCLAQISISFGLARERFELMVITKALTIRGLARSFLLRASAVTLAFPGMCCRVLGGSSQELPLVGGCPLIVLSIRESHNLRDSNSQEGSGFSLSAKGMVFLYAKVEEKNYLVMILTNADARDRHK